MKRGPTLRLAIDGRHSPFALSLQLATGVNKVFVDIGGNRELPTIAALIPLLHRLLSPELIVGTALSDVSLDGELFTWIIYVSLRPSIPLVYPLNLSPTSPSYARSPLPSSFRSEERGAAREGGRPRVRLPFLGGGGRGRPWRRGVGPRALGGAGRRAVVDPLRAQGRVLRGAGQGGGRWGSRRGGSAAEAARQHAGACRDGGARTL